MFFWFQVTKCQCQVVNLGAGFDTTFWRLREQGLTPQSFIEIDFPTVVMRKGHAIKRKKPLLAGISTEGNFLVTTDNKCGYPERKKGLFFPCNCNLLQLLTMSSCMPCIRNCPLILRHRYGCMHLVCVCSTHDVTVVRSKNGGNQGDTPSRYCPNQVRTK